MKSFLVQRIRNVVAIKVGIPVIIGGVSVLVVFMVVAAAVSAVLAPVEAAKNAVGSFFSLDSSEVGDIDLAGCLGVDAAQMNDIVQSVPPRTDISLAWAWIAFRSEEEDRGVEPPTYDSIVAFLDSPDATGISAGSGDDALPEVTSRYDLAAAAGVLDLIDREMIALSEDLTDELTVALVDNCML